MTCCLSRVVLMLCALVMAIGTDTIADTALGDWGHFLYNYGEQRHKYFNNPDGRAFTIGIHYMQRPPSPAPLTVQVRVTGPDGDVVLEGDYQIKRAECLLNIPAGESGVYRLQVASRGHIFWVSSSLSESVLYTGNPEEGLNSMVVLCP